MTPSPTEEAIRLAIECGWKPHSLLNFERVEEIENGIVFFEIRTAPDRVAHHSLHLEEVFLDLLFWHNLGVAMKWPDEIEYEVNCEPLDRSYNVYEVMHQETWLYHWHRFINYLADGKTPESFFSELLKK